MINSNSNEPAMPVNMKPEYQHQYFGVTKREHFAGLAMQGILSNAQAAEVYTTGNIVVETALWYADALLSELEKDAQ